MPTNAPTPPEPDSEGATGPASSNEFAGARDHFGLTPKPKVKTQRVDPLLGVDLGGVKIVRLIGEGGMGRVYEARQEKPSRAVAVKVIRQGITSEKTMRRFEREAEFLARLQHPGIAQIFIVGTYSSDFGDVPFYVMEFLENAKPITNYVHEQGLGLHDRLRLFQHICEAVSHGHDRGIVHRDLKPGNILVDALGNAKVIDFGVARSTDSDLTLESMKTDTGQLIGTVQYMSPEQFGDDPDDLDGRADVYSLGVVLYEVLSGTAPYSVKKKALHEASRVVCEQVPMPLRLVDKSIPKDVSAIAERCLQKERNRRYHTAGELAADIGRFLTGQPVRAKPSGRRLRGVLSWLTGTRAGVIVSVLMVMSVVMSVVMSAVMLLPGQLLVGRPVTNTPAPAPATGPTSAPVATAEVPHVRPDVPLSAIPPERIKSSPTPPQEPQVAFFEATSEWTKSGLIVREGDCYTITVTGECTDSSGRRFGPDGPMPADKKTQLGAPKDISDNKTHWEFFTHDHPRQILTAKVGDAAVIMAIGSGLTFIAPADGELAFRLNDRQLGDENSRGRLSIELVPIANPEFVAQDGTTTIITRVDDLTYLLFEPEGLRWDYRTMLSTNEGDYPTLINGIAWWPERDVRKFTRSKLLQTRAFSWAAGSNAIEPKVGLLPGLNGPHAEVMPGTSRDGTPALKFSDPETAVSEISCVISRH